MPPLWSSRMERKKRRQKKKAKSKMVSRPASTPITPRKMRTPPSRGVCRRRDALATQCKVLVAGRGGKHKKPAFLLCRNFGSHAELISGCLCLQERKLKNVSKRTGNRKLINLTTWDSKRKSCVESTPSVSRIRPPSSRRRSCLSSRLRTQLHR